MLGARGSKKKEELPARGEKGCAHSQPQGGATVNETFTEDYGSTEKGHSF